MERARAIELMDGLHGALGYFYAGGAEEPLRELLDEEVVWRVPGESPIAGEHRGREAVLGYLRRRRALAAQSLRLHPGELLVGDGDRVAVLTDGSAEIAGVQRSWSTVGVYRFRAGRVAECWLLATDQREFDEIWSAAAEPTGV